MQYSQYCPQEEDWDNARPRFDDSNETFIKGRGTGIGTCNSSARADANRIDKYPARTICIFETSHTSDQASTYDIVYYDSNLEYPREEYR